MFLFRASILICLLAVVPVFSSAYNEEKTEENLPLESNEEKMHNIAERGLSDGIKSELSSVFNVENYLKAAQEIGKVVVYCLQSISNFFKPQLVEEAIAHLKCPGCAFVGRFIRKLMDIGNDVLNFVAHSNFMTQKPTQENLHDVIFDVVLIITEHIHYLTASLRKAARIAFDTKNANFDALNNAKLDNQIFTDVLNSGHKLAGQISKGIVKLSSPAVRNTIYRFIVESTLPFKNEIAEMAKIIIENLNYIAKDITRTKFVREKPSWKYVNEFWVIATKSSVLYSLKTGEEVSKGIFKIILQLKGQSRAMKRPENFVTEFPVERGVIVKAINNILSYLPKVPIERIMQIIHKTLNLGSRLLIEITENTGVKNLHKTVETIGQVITNIVANAAKFAVEELHRLAVATAQSKFITQPPSWDNAKEYALFITKSVVNILRRLADQMKKHFDEKVAKLIQVPSWFLELVAIIVPKYYLEKAQQYGKSVASGLQSISGPQPQRALKEFVTGSGLPKSEKLGEILMHTMAYIHEVAGVIKKSRFLSSSPTIENLAYTIIEAIKVAISNGLKTFSDSMAVVETIFLT